MSKRVAEESPAAGPAKFSKDGNTPAEETVHTTETLTMELRAAEQDTTTENLTTPSSDVGPIDLSKDIDLRSTEGTVQPKPVDSQTKGYYRRSTDSKPVSSGPKARVLQTYILNYKPRVEAAISLNGPDPEVRFSSSEGVFYITGDEFLQLANQRADWPVSPVSLHSARLEPIQDGFRFVRYGQDMSHDFFPIAVFDIQKFSVKRLKEKLDIMSEHVFHLQASRPAIIEMFNSIVKVYKEEYARVHSFLTLLEQADHFDRVVDGYTPTVAIVRDFSNHLTDVCRFNYYNLCGIAIAQKYYIHSLLK